MTTLRASSIYASLCTELASSCESAWLSKSTGYPSGAVTLNAGASRGIFFVGQLAVRLCLVEVQVDGVHWNGAIPLHAPTVHGFHPRSSSPGPSVALPLLASRFRQIDVPFAQRAALFHHFAWFLESAVAIVACAGDAVSMKSRLFHAAALSDQDCREKKRRCDELAHYHCSKTAQ
eukprot:CAMPEP_0174831592 /NCGR_PEP_ID=MMETSP1114-20130205/3183_1 /TAXON_ID=312471 /ORGANISM="Neobodo designis, Strain CCAP 1951/1" /LENGTH=175 /DNA_ID=CAMNT_0016065419 /DNA_START=36 /DNA_END=564 /DNA_ORIENTATION=-